MEAPWTQEGPSIDPPRQDHGPTMDPPRTQHGGTTEARLIPIEAPQITMDSPQAHRGRATDPAGTTMDPERRNHGAVMGSPRRKHHGETTATRR